MDVSIVVCCYNSADRICATLAALALQELKSTQAELILVNNNCKDNTIELAAEFWQKSNAPFEMRVIDELTPGLSYARQRGVQESKGEIIIFCDDDNHLDNSYVFNAVKVMKDNPRIGVLGGQSRAIAEEEIPTWFYTYYSNYACGVLSLESGDITSRKWIWGAGMVMRRRTLLSLYSQLSHLSSDRIGGSFSSGGDVELCYWHILMDYQLWYCEDLSLNHFMSKSRLQKSVAKAQFLGQKESAQILEPVNEIVSYYIEYKAGLISVKNVLKSLSQLKLRAAVNYIYYGLVFKKIIKHEIFFRCQSAKSGLQNIS